MGDKRYWVVEFIDGLQIIPRNWFCNDQKEEVFWPTNIKDFKAYDHAVESMKSIDFDKSTVVTVKRIFGATDHFQVAKDKLKEAETVSDINSDVEGPKKRKQRQDRAAKIIYSESESADDPAESPPDGRIKKYPTPPGKTSHQKTAQKRKYGSHESETTQPSSSRFNSTPTTKKDQKTAEKRKYESHESDTTQPSSSSLNSTPNTKRESHNNYSKKVVHEQSGEKHKTRMGPRIISSVAVEKPTAGTHLSRSITGLGDPSTDYGQIQFQNSVMRQLAEMKQKMNMIIVNQNDLMDQCKKLNSNPELEGELQIDENIKDIIAVLPLSNDDELNNVETAILSVNCYKKLVKELSKIGGNSLKTVALNLVKRIFSNEVAQNYSWEGKKKKKKFSDLKLCNVIIDAARRRHEDATDHEISQPIKDWLRHASERAKKKNAPDTATS